MEEVLIRPDDLTAREFSALLYMINREHWKLDYYDKSRPPSGQDLANFLNTSRSRAYQYVSSLINKDYLDADFKATNKCKGLNRTVGTNSVKGIK